MFSTNNISDPGIDLAGSAHMHYSPGVKVIGLPCTSGIRPSWIVRALEVGFDGVFVASDGDECAYLPDCAERSSRIVGEAQAALGSAGIEPQRVRLAAICSVCAEPFTKHVQQFSSALAELGPAATEVSTMTDECAVPDARQTDYDVLVVGSGIGGMESALKLGDMGYKVLLVEKEASVGGKMILLSKVFPTLDCASCISTPKMAATIHHPNITAMTYSRVDGIRRSADGTFHASVTRKARFVDVDTCTGCAKCEMACTVAVPDQFNADLVARRAAYIAFPQAVPKKAVIDRAGSSPCSFACPAGIQAHGYVSLIRSGEYEKAYRLVLDATPLVGTLGRACYAPCEVDCTRGSLEGTLPIRRLKRFVADWPRGRRRRARRRGRARQRPAGRDRRLGPDRADRRLAARAAGLRRQDLRGGAGAGGFLRLAIPSYRLPEAVVERDIDNVRAIGVEIVTDSPGPRSRGAQGRGLRRGARRDRDAPVHPARCPGRGPPGGPRRHRLPAQGEARRADGSDGRRVVVVGGGNVAMDAARTARRLGAASVTVAYRRGRDEMPAHHVEADDAEREGVAFSLQVAPAEVLGDANGAVSGLRCMRMRLGEPDASGRRRPEPIPGSEMVLPCELIVERDRDDRGRERVRRSARDRGPRPAAGRSGHAPDGRCRGSSPRATRSTGPRTSRGPSARAVAPPT